MSLLSKNDVNFLLKSDYRELLQMMNDVNSQRENNIITYSKNVFLPLTEVCRNICGYCTFRKDTNLSDTKILMKPDEVMNVVRNADSFNCKEALFTFGEQPEYDEHVKFALNEIGYENIVEYLHFLCSETLEKSNLLPHSNPGILTRNELKLLKEVNASMGLMLETTSQKLMKNIVHEKSPGKNPEIRIKTIKNAGKLKIPFTTGLLIGIGETLKDRVESLLELRKIQDKYGHIQEIIIQNFKPKPGIPMEKYAEPSVAEMIKMVVVTKLLFPEVSVQVPPNLNTKNSQIFLIAGADDWGGISPLTPDYVNPEAPWPELDDLNNLTEELGFKLKERLPIYPKYITEEFLDIKLLEKIQNMA